MKIIKTNNFKMIKTWNQFNYRISKKAVRQLWNKECKNMYKSKNQSR